MMNGTISIGLRRSNVEEPYYHLDLIDDASRTHCIQIKLTLEQFARALGNQGEVSCEFNIYPALVGKERQTKWETVLVSDPYHLTEAEIDAALKPYEVEGWVAERDGFKNHHRFGAGSVRILFVRFVEPACPDCGLPMIGSHTCQ